MKDLFDERPERGCLSRLQLDRVLGHEQTGLAEAQTHLAGCERCRSRLAELERKQTAVMAGTLVARGVDRIMEAAAAGRRPRWLRPALWAPAAAAVAAACLLLVLVRPEHHGPADGADVIRLKGSPEFEALLVSGTTVRRIHDSESLKSGDTLVFRVTSPRSGLVVLAGLDETGTPAILAQGHDSSWPVRAGTPIQLPLSVELDDAGGGERLFAFFCEQPPQQAALVAGLARAYPLGGGGRRDLRPEGPRTMGGCLVRSVLVRRAPDQR